MDGSMRAHAPNLQGGSGCLEKPWITGRARDRWGRGGTPPGDAHEHFDGAAHVSLQLLLAFQKWASALSIRRPSACGDQSTSVKHPFNCECKCECECDFPPGNAPRIRTPGTARDEQTFTCNRNPPFLKAASSQRQGVK